MKFVCILNINYTEEIRTTKISAEHFNAFASPNFPELAESGVHLKVNKEIIIEEIMEQ